MMHRLNMQRRSQFQKHMRSVLQIIAWGINHFFSYGLGFQDQHTVELAALVILSRHENQ